MSQFKRYLEIVNETETSSRKLMSRLIQDAQGNKIIRTHNQKLKRSAEIFVKQRLSNLNVKYEKLETKKDKEEFLTKLNNINTEFEKIKNLISSKISQKFDDENLKDNASIKQIKTDLMNLAPGNNKILELPLYSIKEYIPWVIEEIKEYEKKLTTRFLNLFQKK